MTYPQAISYLESLVNYEQLKRYAYKKSFSLARVKSFLGSIHNPEQNLKIIHVAGSKGKGSTCAFVAYILRAAGFSVGLYTSPHLHDFRERIRILAPVSVSLRGATATKQSQNQDCFALRARNDTVDSARDFEGMISQNELSALVKELKPIINKYNRQSKCGALSFFEVYTALAFCYFKRKKVDFVVLETGLGGSRDATNVAKALVCGITPISLEHVQVLGRRLSQIAAEKSGIIKVPGAIVVSAFQEKEAAEVIAKRCKKFQAKFIQVGRQIKFSPQLNSRGQMFRIQGRRGVYKNLRLRLLGKYQMANAALAVGLIEALDFYGLAIAPEAIRRGLQNTVWPGRCEVVARNPWLVLDGAHNLASAKVLKSALRENFQYKKLILVLGICQDKDISGICRVLNTLADTVILTRAVTQRAALPGQLSGYFSRKVYLTDSVKEAKLLAKKLARPEDLILVTGSLLVVGEFRDVAR